MEVLILGNGFEINFNPNLVDFNSGFKNWLISHDSEEKINELYDILEEQKSYEIDITLRRTIKHLIKEFKNIDSENTVEDLLYKIGQEFIREFEEIQDKDQESEVFKNIKKILGYYIRVVLKTEYECEKFKAKNFKFLENFRNPNFIFTTNYTNSAFTLAKNWNQIYEGLPIIKTEVKQIHGYFNFENKDITYDNIDINLIDKKSNYFFEKLLSENLKAKVFNFTIFGLSLRNDSEIIRNIIKIGLKNKDVCINYYYMYDEDKKDFIDSVKKEVDFLNNSEDDYELNSYDLTESKIEINRFFSNDQISINFNFKKSDTHFLYKNLNKQK
ncbi:hypothetical protein SSABA_v1c03710 [Spiroplasma sabaudiense Ar-1343]|uniref:SIR2-like domain-containing protein n=1 Tax=Spiroplasma sabaudiense Ar-1343 TaxID=1276257 RepID=W6AAB7_9MOLU|nr:hypothetical protein [Spiroplasma sabaudiense]AHI53780.1 hypothetical protein SSABA_v1c03710 [Spiroplasma sabaudiense Ar-1343]